MIVGARAYLDFRHSRLHRSPQREPRLAVAVVLPGSVDGVTVVAECDGEPLGELQGEKSRESLTGSQVPSAKLILYGQAASRESK